MSDQNRHIESSFQKIRWPTATRVEFNEQVELHNEERAADYSVGVGESELGRDTLDLKATFEEVNSFGSHM